VKTEEYRKLVNKIGKLKAEKIELTEILRLVLLIINKGVKK